MRIRGWPGWQACGNSKTTRATSGSTGSPIGGSSRLTFCGAAGWGAAAGAAAATLIGTGAADARARGCGRGSFGGQLVCGREICQSELSRLALIVQPYRHRQQGGDALPVGSGMRQRRPLGHACAEFVCRYVFRGHQARFAPAAGNGEGIGQVLADFRGILAASQRRAEHEDAALRLSGEGIGEPEVARGNRSRPNCRARSTLPRAGHRPNRTAPG